MRTMLIVVALAIAAAIVGLFLTGQTLWGAAAAGLMWLVLSIRIVGPAEMAVKVLFGVPVSFCDSGFRFVPFLPLQCYLKRYPKKMYSLNYTRQEVITAAGKYKGVSYGAQKLIVDAAAYLNFPREPVAGLDGGSHPLIKILRAGVPTDEAALRDWSEEAAVGALRLAFGQMTWRQAVEDMAAINRIVTAEFGDSDGVLIKAGFRDPGVKLVVTEIHLPRGLEEAMVGPDEARLKVDAAANVAKQRAIEIFGAVLETIAHATGKDVATIRGEFEKDPAKAFRTYKGFLPRGFDVADFVRLAQLLQGHAVFEFRTPNVKDGMTGGLMAAIALLRKMDGGGTGGAATDIRLEEAERIAKEGFPPKT